MTALRILYGIQATGQGHITRARVLGPALQEHGADVDFFLSGRPRHELYGMESFGNFRSVGGLSFVIKDGQVDLRRTFTDNNIGQFLKDVYHLYVRRYDLVITDYEPVTAWAARLKGVPSLGIGHNYVFNRNVPMEDFNRASLTVTRNFAAADTLLPMHWHHFDQDILPPMLPLPTAQQPQKGKIVVYLNFENLDQVVALVSPFKDHDFFIYSSKVDVAEDRGNLRLRPVSLGFRDDLATCEGVICGSGFELPTEAIHMGKKLLVKPLKGQPEQSSNASALRILGLGDVMTALDPENVKSWLEKPSPLPVSYPNTGPSIANWIVNTDRTTVRQLLQSLWSEVRGLNM